MSINNECNKYKHLIHYHIIYREFKQKNDEMALKLKENLTGNNEAMQQQAELMQVSINIWDACHAGHCYHFFPVWVSIIYLIFLLLHRILLLYI